MYNFNIIFPFFIPIFVFGIFFDHSNIRTHCRDKNNLIHSEILDKYLLVDVEINTTLKLLCHFCNEENDNQPKFWYFQDRYGEETERELNIRMSNNKSMNRIHLNSMFDVIIENFDLSDAGMYKCHGPSIQNIENNFNYRLERKILVIYFYIILHKLYIC